MSTQAPPLDADLGTIKTTLPLLKDQTWYDMRVNKVEIKPAGDTGARLIACEFVTVGPAQSIDGTQELGPGVPVFDNLMLSPTGKSTWQMVARNVGSLTQAAQLGSMAAFGPNVQVQLENADKWVHQLVGRIIRVKVGYEPAGVNPKNGKPFREKNSVLLYQPAK